MNYKCLLFLLSFIPGILFAEDSKDKGKVSAKIFANYHHGILSSDPSSALEIRRAYLGYKYTLSEKFYAEVKLDIGSPNDISDYDRFKRYAYFKNAYLGYKYKKLSMQFGLSDTYTFKEQEKFWGYRYIYKSFMDEQKYGSSADIGFLGNYQISKSLSIDFAFLNGEGYGQLQSDDSYKYTAGITGKLKTITLRLYYDYYNSEISESTLASFIGLKIKEKLSLGAEFLYRINENSTKNTNRYGYSVYSTYKMKEKIKLFARYDHAYSSILKGEQIPWNLAKDGSALIAGIEYAPIKEVKIALNYQDWVPYAENIDTKAFIFLNLEVAF